MVSPLGTHALQLFLRYKNARIQRAFTSSQRQNNVFLRRYNAIALHITDLQRPACFTIATRHNPPLLTLTVSRFIRAQDSPLRRTAAWRRPDGERARPP